MSLLKSLKTLEMQSNMILRLKSETFRGSRQMSHAVPLCISIYSVAAFVILADKVPACISLHIFTFPVIFMAVGDVSQAFSVRNEQGDTNRLAKYENWMTINGCVLIFPSFFFFFLFFKEQRGGPPRSLRH